MFVAIREQRSLLRGSLRCDYVLLFNSTHEMWTNVILHLLESCLSPLFSLNFSLATFGRNLSF